METVSFNDLTVSLKKLPEINFLQEEVACGIDKFYFLNNSIGFLLQLKTFI
jgi:hypothetical protein